MPLKLLKKLNLITLAVTLFVGLSNAYAHDSSLAVEGGANGGGGNLHEEVFFTVVGEAIDNLKLFPQFSKIAEQAETVFENQLALRFVDQLTNCKGEFITEPGQYAYSCQGEIRLVKKYWKVWLANKYQAQAHIYRIFHEVLRVTAFSDKRVTNDIGFRTSNQILNVTDLLTNPNCERSYEYLAPAAWIDALKTKFISNSMVGITDNEKGGLTIMIECSGRVISGGGNSDDLDSCSDISKKYDMISSLKDEKIIMLPNGEHVKAIATRKCIGSEKAVNVSN